MRPFDTSSGDALADRRFDFAEMLLQSGDAAAAAELMLQALERAPGWAFGWFMLGEMHEAAGEMDAATEAFRTARKLDPDDRVGAILKLYLRGAIEFPEAMPPAFVETLFDQYAGKFEQSLVDKLDYRAPGLLLDAVLAAGAGRFDCAIDLGCGTGLMGEKLRPHADRLEGYDISSGMLRKAMQKGVYDKLGKEDLATFLFEAPRADLAVAADVYLYVGGLERVFANAATMLVDGGLFAFSVEKLDAERGFELRETRRYAHSSAYVRNCMDKAGFDVVDIAEETIRMDRNAPVTGLIVVARKARPAV